MFRCHNIAVCSRMRLAGGMHVPLSHAHKLSVATCTSQHSFDMRLRIQPEALRDVVRDRRGRVPVGLPARRAGRPSQTQPLPGAKKRSADEQLTLANSSVCACTLQKAPLQ